MHGERCFRGAWLTLRAKSERQFRISKAFYKNNAASSKACTGANGALLSPQSLPRKDRASDYRNTDHDVPSTSIST